MGNTPPSTPVANIESNNVKLPKHVRTAEELLPTIDLGSASAVPEPMMKENTDENDTLLKNISVIKMETRIC
jgi:hypothetical protein